MIKGGREVRVTRCTTGSTIVGDLREKCFLLGWEGREKVLEGFSPPGLEAGIDAVGVCLE